MSLECENGNIVHVREKSLAVLCVFLGNSVKIESLTAVNLSDYFVFELACRLNLFSQHLGMNKVVHPDSAALVFIHISRAYTSFGSTDILTASESL